MFVRENFTSIDKIENLEHGGQTPAIVIGNNCFASYSYEYLDIELNHPFSWSFFEAESFLKLIKDGLDAYDFSKVKFAMVYDELLKT